MSRPDERLQESSEELRASDESAQEERGPKTAVKTEAIDNRKSTALKVKALGRTDFT